MIIYIDIMKRLKENGWTTYRLRKERKIGDATVQRIKSNQSISTETINTICELCDCQPGDIMIYKREG
ncbi:MAG: helix-turn-helix transcriptional regulator [Solobacterium sp.]|nr:helix-turn-helix transcriptional regulator [Solobacterium sp.]